MKMDADNFLDKVERNFGWVFAVWTIFVLACMASIGFVLFHFISKVW